MVIFNFLSENGGGVFVRILYGHVNKPHFNFLIVSAAVLCLSMTSCIVQTWKGVAPSLEPATTEQPSQNAGPIYIYISPYLTDDVSYSKQLYTAPPHIAHRFFQTKLSGSTEFDRIKFTDAPPEKGLFCTVRVSEDIVLPINGWKAAYVVATSATLWLIPLYDNSLGYRVTYEIFVDAQSRKQYAYDLHGRTLQWTFSIFALPFLSGNWDITMDPSRRGGIMWNDRLGDALWSTMRQFMKDGAKDGYF